jgi:hypothetical protein
MGRIKTYKYYLNDNLCDVKTGKPIIVAARSKAWVCGRWLAGIVISHPAGGMDVCPLSIVYCRGEVSASG